MARAPVQLPHQLHIARPVRHRNIGPLLRHRVDTAARLQRGRVTGGGRCSYSWSEHRAVVAYSSA